MATTIVNQVFSGGNAVTIPGTATSGNLLVVVGGARDPDSLAAPVFTPPAGWTKVAEITPMEQHSAFIAWKISDGTETGSIAWSSDQDPTVVDFCGYIQFNNPDVTTWQFDVASVNGTGAANASSIAAGTTGTLDSADGVAVVVGTSRTGSEGLSTNLGTSINEQDAGTANFITAWLNLTATTALNPTISESNGSSRMGAAIAVFNDSTGGPTTVTGTASGTVSASGSVTATSAEGIFTGTASGVVSVSGSASATITEAVTSGTAAGAISASGAASGTVTVPVTGVATGTISVTGAVEVLSGDIADTFTYSDGALNTVSSSVWGTPVGTSPNVTSGQVSAPGASTVYTSIHQTSVGSANQSVSADVTLAGNYTEAGVIARANNTDGTYYRAVWFRSSTGRYSLYKRVAGSYTLIEQSSSDVGFTGTRNIRLDVNGNQLTVYADDVAVIGPLTDNSITSGNYAGVELYRTDPSDALRLDNFEASALAGPVTATAAGTISAAATVTATPTEAVFTGTGVGTISVSGTAAVDAATILLYYGTTPVDAVYIGATAVDAIYHGSTQLL